MAHGNARPPKGRRKEMRGSFEAEHAALVDRAADHLGMIRSSFIRWATIEKAREVLADLNAEPFA